MTDKTNMPALRLLEAPEKALPAEVATALQVDAAAEAEAQGSEAYAAMLELAGIAGVRDLGPVMAADLKPKNKLQRAIAHQAAAAHHFAMTFMGRADTWARRAEHEFRMGNTQAAALANIEAARVGNTAARLMSATVEAALALDRLKRGAKQTVIVRHMTVKDGGQAIVAGKVGGGGRSRSGGRGRAE